MLPDEGGITGMPLGVPWNETGERLAYGIFMSDESPNGVLVVRRVETEEVELRVVGVNAGAATFSPDGKYILCGKVPSLPGKPMTIVSVETHAEVEWLTAFRCMALPAGDINGMTVGWRRKPDADAADSGSDGLPVLLHAAVGAQFCVVDVDTARHAVEDNAWGVEQLIALTESDEGDALSKVLSAAPHCVNIRHPESGDTVLHHYARERQVDAIASWLSSEEVCVTPIRNVAGHTALQVAILGQEKTIAKLLWRNLTHSLNYVSSPLVTEELQTLAETMPELVLSFLEDIEDAALRTVTTFRTKLYRAEVCGLETATLPEGGESDGSGSVIPSVWSDLIEGGAGSRSRHRRRMAEHCLVASKVLMLPHFLGERSRSPFHTIVRRCGSDVYESKLMSLCVQSKWELNVWPRLRVQLVLYFVCLVLASCAMVASSAQGDEEASSSSVGMAVHVLQGTMMVSEVLSLYNEGLQLVREGSTIYFSGPWNLVDVSASVSLLVGGVGHFTAHMASVRTIGALGVTLKWLGIVDYLRCFEKTGSLVRIVLVRMRRCLPAFAGRLHLTHCYAVSRR